MMPLDKTTNTATQQEQQQQQQRQQQQQQQQQVDAASASEAHPEQVEDSVISNHIKKVAMLADEDPLLISQSLTYVTDDGSVMHTFMSAPFSLGFKVQFFILEVILIVLMIAAVPIGAHGTVVGVCIANLFVLAWFWYNLVRSVDVTSDGTLRFWIGNIEVDVPFDKIVSIRRVAATTPCSMFVTPLPYRGFLSIPTDGVAIVTTVPSSPFWLWPRSAGRPERTCCFGMFSCPRLTIVFSPAGGGLNFIREVESEMRNFSNGKIPTSRMNAGQRGPMATHADYLDV